MPSLSVIILTHNEEIHIERAIRSVRCVAERIFVVDSGSTDRTREIATASGAAVLQNAWINHATQFNWALDNCPITTRWILRLDADECVSERLQEEFATRLDALPADVVGLTVPLWRRFLGRRMLHGGVRERQLLRVFRTGHGRDEQSWMDEHIAVTGGRVLALAGPLTDDSLQNLTWWTNKHNNYASREALEVLLRRSGRVGGDGAIAGQARRVRWMKQSVYYRLPPVFRALAFFLIRYFFMLGFLDGKEGLIFHFLQGAWYRALVDAKLYEVERAMRARGLGFEEAVSACLQIDLGLAGSRSG